MIPYNPSSFNTNKTILEQILELKNWLKENPSYRIYISEEDFDPTQITYDLTQVYDPDETLNVGDAVMFHNGFLSDVVSIDRDNNEFNRGSFVDMKGPQGPRGYTGNTGPQGPQGVSITNATIDSSDHLIVTLSNGSTIDAGLVVDGTKAYIIQLTSYAGTLTADDLAIVNDPSKLCVIDYYVNSKHSFYFKDRQITDGWRFSNLDYVEGSQITIIQYFEIDSATGSYLQDFTETFIRAENINSYNATSGKVLQADGNGGASWEDAGGGSVELEIPYSQIGSALSDDDYAICLTADKMIVDYGGGDSLEYTRDSESSTEIRFTRTYSAGVGALVVTKATKVVTNPTNKLVASDLSSGTATSGQVLKADGNGGASWQTPSGGSTLNKYTKSGSSLTMSLLKSILNNAKGNVNGSIGLLLDGYGYAQIPIGCFQKMDANRYTINGVIRLNQTNSMYIVYGIIQNGRTDFDSNYSKAFKIDGNNFVITQINGFNYDATSTYIEYYNDTEILS